MSIHIGAAIEAWHKGVFIGFRKGIKGLCLGLPSCGFYAIFCGVF
jgi:hypothetical protein